MATAALSLTTYQHRIKGKAHTSTTISARCIRACHLRCLVPNRLLTGENTGLNSPIRAIIAEQLANAFHLSVGLSPFFRLKAHAPFLADHHLFLI